MKVLTSLRRSAGRSAPLFAVACSLLWVPPAASNPPPPPGPFAVPDVHVIRLTDASVGVKSGDLRMMFEILNWTNVEVHGVVLVENTATDLLPATSGGIPVVVSAYVEPEGRPLDPLLKAEDDDANFPPTDGTIDPPKNGANNAYTGTRPTPTKIAYVGDGPIPPRDLLGAADANASCALVPGCAGGVIAEVERIDNGRNDAGAGTVDNVLDGFVLEFADFDPGEVISFNVFLIDEFGQPIGYWDGANFAGNAFGFGTLNVFLGDGAAPRRSHGPPVWTRPSRGPIIGNTGTVDPPNNLRDVFVTNDQFQIEIGAAMTAPFRDPNDNNLLLGGGGVGVNAVPHPSVPVELMSFTVE